MINEELRLDTNPYSALERNGSAPLYEIVNCKLCHDWHSLNDRPLQGIHKRKHAIRVYKAIKKDALERLDHMKPLLTIWEYYLNERSQKDLWHVFRHADLHYAIKDLLRYWRKYTKFTFYFAQDLRNALKQCFALTEDKPDDYDLDQLSRFVLALSKTNEILGLIKTIDESWFAKASKESYLRDIRASLFPHYLWDIWEGPLETEYVGYRENKETKQVEGPFYRKFPKPYLKLQARNVIEATFKRIDAELAPKEEEFPLWTLPQEREK